MTNLTSNKTTLQTYINDILSYRNIDYIVKLNTDGILVVITLLNDSKKTIKFHNRVIKSNYANCISRFDNFMYNVPS